MTSDTPHTSFTPRRPVISDLPDRLRGHGFAPRADSDGVPDQATAAFTRAVEQGFYEPYLSDQHLQKSYVSSYSGEAHYLYGVYAEPEAGDGQLEQQFGFDAHYPMATWDDFDKTLNTGAGLVNTRLISAVTVNPGYRRRGILRHMMTTALARAVDEGISLAALGASEGSIYGRFGFGVATRQCSVEVTTTGGMGTFGLREHPTGKVVPVDPSTLDEVIDQLWESAHSRTRGSVGRQAFYRETGTARVNPEDGSQWDRKLRAAMHIRSDGSLGGVVWWTFSGWKSKPLSVEVNDMLTHDETSRRELWRYLAGLDQVEQVKTAAAVDDPMQWAVSNPRSWRITRVSDLLWIRILNAARALEERQWSADGSFVLDIADPLGITDGAFAVAVRNGSAQVSCLGEVGEGETASDRFALDVETLAAVYLGDVSVVNMHTAGRITADDCVDWSAFAATFDLPTAPYCSTHF